jgi:hypothetical protein
MPLATKNNAIIVKDGKVAENCNCCVCDACANLCLFKMDIVSPFSLSGPSPCSALSNDNSFSTSNHAPCAGFTNNFYSLSSGRPASIVQYGGFSVDGRAIFASFNYTAVNSVTASCGVHLQCVSQREWYAITSWQVTSNHIQIIKSSRRKLSSACISSSYVNCEGVTVDSRQEFLDEQPDITVSYSSDGFGEWQNSSVASNSIQEACRDNLIDTFSATFRIIKQSTCNPLP